jgi:hypothetical protein
MGFFFLAKKFPFILQSIKESDGVNFIGTAPFPFILIFEKKNAHGIKKSAFEISKVKIMINHVNLIHAKMQPQRLEI